MATPETCVSHLRFFLATFLGEDEVVVFCFMSHQHFYLEECLCLRTYIYIIPVKYNVMLLCCLKTYSTCLFCHTLSSGFLNKV